MAVSTSFLVIRVECTLDLPWATTRHTTKVVLFFYMSVCRLASDPESSWRDIESETQKSALWLKYNCYYRRRTSSFGVSFWLASRVTIYNYLFVVPLPISIVHHHVVIKKLLTVTEHKQLLVFCCKSKRDLLVSTKREDETDSCLFLRARKVHLSCVV